MRASGWINQLLPGWALYLLILVLAAIIYLRVFSEPISRRRQVVVLLLLAVGCSLFWLMQLAGFPIVAILLTTLGCIFAVQLRRWWEAALARRRKVRRNRKHETIA